MSSEVDTDLYRSLDSGSLLSELINTVLVALRQGIFFGVETRVPYAITSILRPILFNKPGRPIQKSIQFFSAQALAHGWIIARIAIVFKLCERGLATLANEKNPKPWHSFFAGALAGYLVMARDKSYASMKKQINMAIGIRTIYAISAYCVRKGLIPIPTVTHTPEGYKNGTTIFYTLMWGLVMWHWRHEAKSFKGEMNSAQVSQMDFIYNNFKLTEGWTDSTHLPWLISLFIFRETL